MKPTLGSFMNFSSHQCKSQTTICIHTVGANLVGCLVSFYCSHFHSLFLYFYIRYLHVLIVLLPSTYPTNHRNINNNKTGNSRRPSIKTIHLWRNPIRQRNRPKILARAWNRRSQNPSPQRTPTPPHPHETRKNDESYR